MVIADPLSPSQICTGRRSGASKRARPGSVSYSHLFRSPCVRSPSTYKQQVKVESVGLIADTYCILAEVKTKID